MSLYKYTEKEAANLLIGQNGFDVIAEHDTTVVAPDTGSWVAIQALGKDSSGTTEFLKIKVTSNVGIVTYADNSYCVPCLLMAC